METFIVLRLLYATRCPESIGRFTRAADLGIIPDLTGRAAIPKNNSRREAAVNKTRALFIFLVIGAVLLMTGGIAAQEQKEQKKYKEAPAEAILGPWALQIDAGEEFYYLLLTLQKVEGHLAGTLSEVNGWFTDVPLTDRTWDGTTLKFKVVTVTPPDGAERPWFAEMKLIDNAWVGTISLPDLGMAAPVTGTRKLKVP
jgi:hypothetical protein